MHHFDLPKHGYKVEHLLFFVAGETIASKWVDVVNLFLLYAAIRMESFGP